MVRHSGGCRPQDGGQKGTRRSHLGGTTRGSQPPLPAHSPTCNCADRAPRNKLPHFTSPRSEWLCGAKQCPKEGLLKGADAGSIRKHMGVRVRVHVNFPTRFVLHCSKLPNNAYFNKDSAQPCMHACMCVCARDSYLSPRIQRPWKAR